jgi:ABC-type transport system substrate-binding protein
MKAYPYILRSIVLLILISLALSACNSPTATATQNVPPTQPLEQTPTQTNIQNPPTATPLPFSGPMKSMPTVTRALKLDPAITQDADSLLISGYIYEGLVSLNSKGEPQAALATRWEISDDGLDYIFYLRPDVKFHDGSLLTADVVLANFNRWFDAKDPLRGKGNYAAWLEAFKGYRGELADNGTPKSNFDGIEKVDNLTVLIHLSRQEPDLIKILAQPAFAIIQTGSLAVQGENYGTSQGSAIGTGPYQVGAWTDEGLLLFPHAGYWGTAQTEGLQFSWKK